MKAGLLILSLAAIAFAGPVKRQADVGDATCAARCTGAHNKYRYKTGHSYEYSVMTSTDVEIPSYTTHNSNVTHRAQIVIDVVAPCEYVLKVQSISVTGTDVPSTFASDVTEHPLRFAFDDGRIEAVCPNDDESTWVVNLKRGILSSLQNAWEADDLKVHENDIAGRCQSTYRREKQGDNTVYHRKKHVQSCKGHHNMHGTMRAVAYDVNSDVQSSTMSNADHSCSHTVNGDGVLSSATCTEWHAFTPFTERQEGTIKSTTRTQITLTKHHDGVSTSNTRFGQRQSMAFDASEMDYEVSTNAENTVRQTLNEMCVSSQHYVVKETPSQFVRLVAALRQMSEQNIENVITESKATPKCNKQSQWLMDALPMCGSEQCVKAMVAVLKTNALTENEKYAWFTSLAFVPKASTEMLRAVVTLVDVQGSPSRGLLGVSSLVHTYCTAHPSCAEEEVVRTLVQKLNNKLGTHCETDGSSRNVEDMIIVLKTLGNIGHINDAVDTLLSCAEHKRNPTSIRVAAVQSMRRLPCDHDQRDRLMSLYKTQNEDVEVRIFAFLTIMKCPTRELVNEINNALESETVNQVGSFVWSYLKERRSSSDPTQHRLQSLLREVHITRRFDNDARKFSRYQEMGQYARTTNTGAHMENAVVFVPGSYTPRHAFVNLTVHMFGHSVNFLEVGGRSEGLDHMMHNMFGPEGMITSPNNYYFNEENKEDNEDEQYKQLKNKFEERPNYESDERLALSMYFKVFGDELAYFGFDDSAVMDSVKAKADFKTITDMLARHRDIKMAKNLIFMDFTKSLPTSGLPLRVTVTGAASLNVEVSGKADLTKMLQKPHDIDINTSVKPSAAIEIATTLAVHCAGIKSGVRLLSRMHTSTAFETEMQLKQGKIFRVSLGVPQDNMQIVDFEFTGVGVVNNNEVAIVEPSEYKHDEYCTPDAFNTGLGMRTCLGMSQPAGARLFPRRVWMNIEKTDETLETYEATIEMAQNTIIPYPREFVFNTPGSKVNREVRVSLDNEDEKRVLNVKVPGRTYKFEADFDQPTTDEYNGQLTMTVDETDKYTMETTLKRSGEGLHRRTELDAKATLPEREPIVLNAYVDMNGFKKVDVHSKLSGLEQKPREFNFKLNAPESSRDGMFNVHVDYSCPMQSTLFAIEAETKRPNYAAKIEVEHKSLTGAYEPVKFRLDMSHEEERNGNELIVKRKYELVKSLHTPSNFELSTIQRTEHKNGEMKATLKYGDQLAHQAHFRIERKAPTDDRYEFNAELAVPALNIDNEAKVTYENTWPEMLHAEAVIMRRGGDSKREVSLHMKQSQSPLYSMTMEMKMRFEHTNVDWRIYKDMKQISAHDYKSKTVLQWGPGKNVEGDVKLKWQKTEDGYDYSVDGEAKITGVEEQFTFHKIVSVTGNGMKYSAALKRGTQAIYDLNWQVDKESQTKSTFNSHFKSYYLSNMDYRINGEVEKTDKTRQYEVTLSEGETETARAGIIVPIRMERGWDSEDKQVKLSLEWDLNVSPRKLSGDYMLHHEESGRTRRHKIDIVSLVSDAEYKWTSHIVKSEYYTMNNTLLKDNKQMLSLHWGMQKNQELFEFDIGMKTDEPLQQRHRTGLFIIEKTDEKTLVHGDLTCHIDNVKASFEVKDERPNDDTRFITFDAQAGELQLRAENKYVNTDNHFEFSGMRKLKWAANKEINHNFAIEKKNGKYRYYEAAETPFNALKDYELKYDGECDSSKVCTHVSSVNMNSEEKLRVQVTNTYDDQWKAVEREIKLRTQRESLGEIVGKYIKNRQERDGMIEKTFETSLTWANANKLRFHGKFATDSDQRVEYDTVWEAKVDDKADMKTRMTLKQSPTINKVEATMKSFDEIYSLNSEIDIESRSGVVKVQTPFNALQSAQVKILSKDNGEYEMSTERNGETGALITGTIRTTGEIRKAHFKVDNIQTPIEIDGEFVVKQDEKRVKLIITKNYDSDDKKAYGIDITSALNRKALTVIHPKRRPHVEWRHNDNSIELWIQPNKENGRDATKLIVRKENYNYIVELNDPALSHPITVTAGYSYLSACPTGITIPECSGLHIFYSVKYSDDQNNKVIVDMHLLRGKQSSHTEMSIKHPVSHFHQKYYSTYRADDGMKVRHEMGVEVQTPSNTNHYSIESIYERGQGSHMKLRHPSGSCTIKYEFVDNEFRVLFINDATNKPNWIVAVHVQSPKFQIEIRRSATSDVILHISQDMTDKNTLEKRMWHKDSNDKRHDDVYVKLWLDRADLLKVRIHVTPQSWSNLLESLTTADVSMSGVSHDNILHDIIRSSADGLKNVNDKLVQHVKPMADSWKQEQESMEDDMGMSVSDMIDIVQDWYEMTRELTMANIDVMEMTIKEWTEGTMFNSLHKLWFEIRRSAHDVSRAVVRPISESAEEFIKLLKKVTKEIMEWTEDVQTFLRENEYVQQIKETLDLIWQYIKKYTNYNEMRKSVKEYMRSVNENYDSAMDTYNTWMDTLMDYSIIRSVYAAIEPIIDELVTFDVRDIINRVVEYAGEIADGNSFSDYLPKVTYYNQEEGQVEIQLPLPVKASSLEDLVNKLEPSSMHTYLQNIQERLQDVLGTDGRISEGLWQQEGTRRAPSADEAMHLGEAHKSTAYLLGDKHILTFDGRVMSLVADCEYLLARDFLSDKFTVTATFTKNGGRTVLQSIKTIFRKQTIRFSLDGQVTVNEQPSELPYQFMDTFEGQALITAKRNDHGVVLRTFDGVEVACDWHYRVCTVTLPGHYHGHSNGLLGSNDNEPSNDMHMPNGELNDDIAKFADSWAIRGGSCKAEVAAEPNPSETLSTECDNLFRMRSSPLRTCFRRVAPRAFHQMCQFEKCNATAAYVHACKQVDIEVEMPEECLRCEHPQSGSNELFLGGASKEISRDDIKKSADILFVVEERRCMTFAKNKIVTEIADKVVSQLSSYRNIKYGVIGFGGEEIHNSPHFHTGNNAINFDKTGLQTAVDSLEFADADSNAQSVDPITAIHFAATSYPFRPSVAKVVVLLTCTECGYEVDYYDVQQEMLQRNVHLHVFTTQSIEVADEHSHELLGFSASTMYTTSGGEQPQLRQSLSSPHDSCTVLAQEVNGTVWTMQDKEASIFSLPSNTIGQAIDAQQEAVSECQLCECDSFEMAPRTQCVPCQVAQPMSLTGNSFFNVPYIKLRQTLKKAQQSLGAVDQWLI